MYVYACIYFVRGRYYTPSHFLLAFSASIPWLRSQKHHQTVTSKEVGLTTVGLCEINQEVLGRQSETR